MKLKKQLLLFVAGMLIFAVSATHAQASVYGNVGYKDYPWRILIGYNNHYHGNHHHKYYHKHKKYHHKKHYHHKNHGYSHHYRHDHSHYRRSCRY